MSSSVYHARVRYGGGYSLPPPPYRDVIMRGVANTGRTCYFEEEETNR